MAVSNEFMVSMNRILWCEGYIVQRSAKLEDFVATWVILGWLIGFASVCFAMEIIRSKWDICYLKIKSIGKNTHAFVLERTNQVFAVFKGRKVRINICMLRYK